MALIESLFPISDLPMNENMALNFCFRGIRIYLRKKRIFALPDNEDKNQQLRSEASWKINAATTIPRIIIYLYKMDLIEIAPS